MRLTRREFIRASAASAAWMLGGSAWAADPAKPKPMPFKNALIPRKMRPSTPAKGEWVASTCQGCTQWCAIQLYRAGGRMTRVRGNQISKSNHGYVCPRGHLIPQMTYDPDRVKVPLKRTNPMKGRGIDPKFVPISWDEAITLVADKMLELRNAGEPEKLLYMRGRYSPTSTELLYGTLPKIFGTGNYFSHSALCAEAEKMGPGLTQGFFGYRDYDLEKTNCLVVWGADPLASNRQVPNTIHRFHEIVARGTVIAVDPRLSNAAAKAHEWLPPLPGTDGALAGAIAHVLLTEGLWNREFVGDFKDGKNLFVAGSNGRRRRLRREGNLGPGQVVEPGTEGSHPGLRREGIRHPRRADPARRPCHGQGRTQVCRLDGPRRRDVAARHLCGDGGACAERPARLDRCRRRCLGRRQRSPAGQVPQHREVHR
jgi:anaerobic selenocysteine-containing dehydrogenase